MLSRGSKVTGNFILIGIFSLGLFLLGPLFVPIDHQILERGVAQTEAVMEENMTCLLAMSFEDLLEVEVIRAPREKIHEAP